MAGRDEILAWAKEYLDLDSYPDYGPMGLQVAGAEEVRKIACGVSASRELFRRSAEAGAQLVLVHHGLLWDKEPRVVGPVLRERLRALFDADMTLAADLGVGRERRFAAGLGFGGRLAEPVPISDFSARVQERLGQMPLVFSYGPELVERVAVCSGGGARFLAEAAAEGYDCFVTGEAAEPTKHAAKEAGGHFVAGGHYATETLGVRALAAKLAEEFGLDWEFVDLPNPV